MWVYVEVSQRQERITNGRKNVSKELAFGTAYYKINGERVSKNVKAMYLLVQIALPIEY